MKVSHYTKTDLQPVDMPGSAGCRVRWLIGSADHAPNFAMRQFEVEPGGHTPQHMHDYEHEVYVLGGRGEVLERGAPHAIAAGDVVFIAPNEIHQFRNTGDQPLQFLCLIPNSATGKSVTVVPECGHEPTSQPATRSGC
jgi:quercetin dioxygenase-like cupin family protein